MATRLEKADRLSKVLILIAIPVFLVYLILLLYRPPAFPSIEAKEKTLIANLQSIRTAIAMFKTDTGEYPVDLHDLIAKDESTLKTHVKKGTYKGPYRHVYLINPFAYPDENIVHHWKYDPKTGTVKSAVGGMTKDGGKYSDL